MAGCFAGAPGAAPAQARRLAERQGREHVEDEPGDLPHVLIARLARARRKFREGGDDFGFAPDGPGRTVAGLQGGLERRGGSDAEEEMAPRDRERNRLRPGRAGAACGGCGA